MTAADLDQLPADPELPARTAAEAVDSWGLCGVVSQQDRQVTGFVVLVPSPLAPAVDGWTLFRPDPRTAALTAAWVQPSLRGHGLGRQLVQNAAGEAARRGAIALEAVGHPGSARSGSAAAERPDRIPQAFLEAVGFRVVQPHPLEPRLRMDVSTTARWRPDLAAAWERLTGLVVKPIPAQPAGFQHSGGQAVRVDGDSAATPS